MSALAEAIISAFDSSAAITWSAVGVDQAAQPIPRFAVTGTQVEVTSTATGQKEWRVAFDANSTASVPESIRILSGVCDREDHSPFWARLAARSCRLHRPPCRPYPDLF